MNTNADQIYSNYQAQLSDNTTLVLPTGTNRIIHHQGNSINGETNNGTLSNTDYLSNSNIVNYLPNLPVTIINTDLHHQNHHYIKKCDNGFIESKEPQMIHIYGSNIIETTGDLPVLTPLKYMDDYHSNNLNNIVSAGPDEQILSNNEDVMSEKSDCESLNNELSKLPMKNAKRSLPHKKRIAKKLNSDQFSIILSSDDSNNIRSLQSTAPHFECMECGSSFIGQLEFYVHLKEHYEGQSSMLRPGKRKRHIESVDIEIHTEDDGNSVPENLIIESGDAFGFSEPEDMEDFRKEVEKVVETIGDTECLPDESWNYQVTDEIEENSENVEIMQNFTEKMENSVMDQSVFPNQQCDGYMCTQEQNVIKNEDNSEEHQAIMQNYESNSNQMIGNDLGTDEEDDNKTLEQVRLILKTKKHQKQKIHQNDEEFNECLKKIQNFKCNDCNKFFNSRTALGYHLKTHSSERRYVCDQCGKKFLTNGALKVHLRLHTNDRPYKCTFPDCGKSFRQWGDLKYHETSLHSNKKDHICEFCAKAFARKYSLVIHRRIHTGEKTYKCTECDKSFRASSYLLNHKRIHSGERPFVCGVCGKKFRVQGDLKRHTKIHDRVKNGLVKEKKKPNDTKTEPNQSSNIDVKNECTVKEEKLSSVSIMIESITRKVDIDLADVSKKMKRSQRKKKT